MANGNNQITVLLISKIHKPIQGGIFININIFLISMANKFSEIVPFCFSLYKLGITVLLHSTQFFQKLYYSST